MMQFKKNDCVYILNVKENDKRLSYKYKKKTKKLFTFKLVTILNVYEATTKIISTDMQPEKY